MNPLDIKIIYETDWINEAIEDTMVLDSDIPTPPTGFGGYSITLKDDEIWLLGIAHGDQNKPMWIYKYSFNTNTWTLVSQSTRVDDGVYAGGCDFEFINDDLAMVITHYGGDTHGKIYDIKRNVYSQSYSFFNTRVTSDGNVIINSDYLESDDYILVHYIAYAYNYLYTLKISNLSNFGNITYTHIRYESLPTITGDSSISNCKLNGGVYPYAYLYSRDFNKNDIYRINLEDYTSQKITTLPQNEVMRLKRGTGTNLWTTNMYVIQNKIILTNGNFIDVYDIALDKWYNYISYVNSSKTINSISTYVSDGLNNLILKDGVIHTLINGSPYEKTVYLKDKYKNNPVL